MVIDIIYYIFTYTVNDIRAECSTFNLLCKSCYQFTKGTKFLKLSSSLSYDYVFDKGWYEKINKAILDPRNQISLNFKYTCMEKDRLSLIKDVHTVIFDHCETIKDFSELNNNNIKALSLRFIHQEIIDLETLNNLEELNLAGCANKIINLDKMKNIKSLNFTGNRLCGDLKNLPQTIQKLNLSSCYVDDKTVHSNRIRNIYHVNLTGSHKLSNLTGFQNITILNLCDCYNIVDVSPLTNIPNINLSGCRKIHNIDPLKHCTKLILSRCYGVTDVSCLRNVKYLNLAECDNVTNITSLTNVQYLSLNGCENIKCDINILLSHSQIRYLNLSNTTLYKTVSSLYLESSCRINNIISNRRNLNFDAPQAHEFWDYLA